MNQNKSYGEAVINELVKNNNGTNIPDSESAYKSIGDYDIDAQRQVYSAVNFAKIPAYWTIDKTIHEICEEKNRASYGKQDI